MSRLTNFQHIKIEPGLLYNHHVVLITHVADPTIKLGFNYTCSERLTLKNLKAMTPFTHPTNCKNIPADYVRIPFIEGFGTNQPAPLKPCTPHTTQPLPIIANNLNTTHPYVCSSPSSELTDELERGVVTGLNKFNKIHTLGGGFAYTDLDSESQETILALMTHNAVMSNKLNYRGPNMKHEQLVQELADHMASLEEVQVAGLDAVKNYRTILDLLKDTL